MTSHEQARKMARKSGTLSATLEILKIKMEAELNNPTESAQFLVDQIAYIDKQLKKVGE